MLQLLGYHLCLISAIKHVVRESIRRGTEDPRTIAYFSALTLNKLFCPGPHNHTPQANLSFHFTRVFEWGPRPNDLEHNNLQDWLNSTIISEGQLLESTGSCWHSTTTDCEAKNLHHGRNWTLRMPVAWMLDLKVNNTGHDYIMK